MSKSVELLSGTKDSEAHDESFAHSRSRLNFNGKSKSATELRAKSDDIARQKSSNEYQYSNHQSHTPYQHVASVAQRTHIFFSSLKNRWSRSRVKERKKSKGTRSTNSPHKSGIIESDYAADYSSDQSKSSSTTYSPARTIFNHPESPLVRGNGGKLGPGDLSRLCSADTSMKEDPDHSYVGVDDNINDEASRHRKLALRQHAFFQLRLHIRRGTNLVAMDRSGASDPYVKIKCSGRLLHKSRIVQRELNPVWDESITLPIEVFDYDWGLQDDFMGAAPLDLTQLELGHAQDVVLQLKDPAKPRQHLGEIYLTATLWPKNQQEKEQFFQRSNRLADINKRLKSQIWSSVVTIVLIEAKNLLPMDIDGLSDPYVKFRLGTEKYKSKVVNKTLHPVWLEQFDLHLYEDPFSNQELEVTVWDRDKSHQDDLMGRTIIKLGHLEHEKTHQIWQDLEDGAGSIFLLLTISGTTASETISDLATQEEISSERERISLRYCIWNTLERLRDVGHLTVKVFRAQGLVAADLGGKSDPFCVLELVNSRLQTQTEYKTLSPNWQKIFTFNVKDINSVLEVTVFDEDRDHKVEFLGKIAIPLLRIKNGDKRWYVLKDKKLRCRAKGNSPQILMEMTVIWNVIRACLRTINPKEKKFMQPEIKFKRQVFLKNVLRLKAVIMYFIDLGKYIQSCWEWESKTRSIVALVLFVLGCFYFEPYMLPSAALLIMLKYCLVSLITSLPSYSSTFQTTSSLQDSIFYSDESLLTPGGDDDDDDDDKDKEEKKSLKERLQTIQEVTQTVQNSIGYIASLCERVKNLFNFTVPYLSYLSMFLSFLAVIVLYLIPVRYLILAWGVNKFFRKLLRPHSVPNNEVLDLITRVPDDEDLLSYRELKPVPTVDCGGESSSNSLSGIAATRRGHRKRQKAV